MKYEMVTSISFQDIHSSMAVVVVVAVALELYEALPLSQPLPKIYLIR